MPEGCRLPKIVYLFKKLLPPFEEEIRYYCPKCDKILKENTDDPSQLSCLCSEGLISKKQLLRLGFFFIQLSIKKLIRKLLEENSLGKLQKDIVVDPSRNFFEDITDGRLYRCYCNGKLLSKNALSVIMNTDGVPVFNSSKKSLWPVQFFLNELPPTIRKKTYDFTMFMVWES